MPTTEVRETLIIEIQDQLGAWKPVGYMHNSNQRNWFEFLNEYWNFGPRPVLGQVFEEHGPGWIPHARVSLPRWFSHLLPEGVLRSAIAESAHVSAKREFDLLARIGRDDLPGAARAVPVSYPTSPGEPMSRNDDDVSPGVDDPALKFSLDGVQLKFSVYGGERGLTVPATGTAGNFILKFPDTRSGYDAVPEAELGGLELARAVGIATPRAFLVDPHTVVGLERWAEATTGQALAVHRFDRTDEDKRIHMEELAQIISIPTADPRAKYKYASNEMIATVIAGLTGIDSVGQIIDRIVLNIALGNGDAHLKNWAVRYPDSINPELSPVYDIIPTVLYLPDDDLGINLAGTKKFSDLRASSFRKMGERTDFGGEQAEARAHEMWLAVNDSVAILNDYLTTSRYDLLRKRLASIAFTS